jgi:hypothetical protein
MVKLAAAFTENMHFRLTVAGAATSGGRGEILLLATSKLPYILGQAD